MLEVGKLVKVKDMVVAGFIKSPEAVKWAQAHGGSIDNLIETSEEIKINSFTLVEKLHLKDFLHNFHSAEAGKISEEATFQEVFLVLLKNERDQMICTIYDDIEITYTDEEVADNIKQIFPKSVVIS